jgi:hypothetical protein
MRFLIDGTVKYGEVRKAAVDNDVALALMGRFAVDDAGAHYSPEAWETACDDLDFPEGIQDLWIEFQQALLPPTKGAH